MKAVAKTKAKVAASKSANAARQRRFVEEQNTLPEIQPPSKADQVIVDNCRYDLRLALKTYWPEAFFRPFSKEHDTLIADLQEVILRGGFKLEAIWRGGGKTTLGLCATEWAALYGHRAFPVPVGATQSDGNNAVSSIRADIETNPLIERFFPLIAKPFQALDGAPQRCASQHWHPNNGKGRTLIVCKTDELRFPDTGQPGGQTIIVGRGLGAIRGLWRLRKDGKRQRPDFVLLDDPQTRESAQSDGQTDDREKWILGDVLNLAGHDRKVAVYMPATIITKRDLVCRFMARTEWRGRRAPLVERWPGGGDEFPATGPVSELWAQYRELREQEIKREVDAGTAQRWYVENRAGLEQGAVIADPELYDHEGEVSAVQHAMHKFWEIGEHAFLAEMQNDPPEINPEADYRLSSRDVLTRCNGLAQGSPPDDSAAITAAIDLNKEAASWCVTSGSLLPAWHVIDYGKWRPAGRHALWQQGDKTIVDKAIFSAVEGVVLHILQKPYGQSIKAIAIDSSGTWTATVYDCVKQLRNTYKSVRIYASRGLPGDRYEQPKTRGVLRRRGFHADVRQRAYAGYSIDNILYYDSHYWRMTMQRGWLSLVGSEGSVSVWGDKSARHIQFAEEVSAERLVKTQIIGERVRAQFDVTGPNHLGDCLEICAALLSTEGVVPDGVARGKRKDRAGIRTPVQPVAAVDPVVDGDVEPAKPARVERMTIKPRTLPRRGSWATRF